jgi:beta-galactosidase GanA
LPSPGLWPDVLAKFKALGFSAASFYVDWALLESQPGKIIEPAVMALDDLFAAAAEVGIYLIARPGPYINAETAAGGYPGWTLRLNATLRSSQPESEAAIENYVAWVVRKIAAAEIGKGGPVIMYQPENEYSSWPGVAATDFPTQENKEYMAFVEQKFEEAGVTVPSLVNDNLNLGSFAPGTGLGETDIYGIDAYPMRYDCKSCFSFCG